MQVELTEDEALVLFDLLADYGASHDSRQLLVRHAAERNALWALHATLERCLLAPLQQDYSEQLVAARLRVEEQGGSW